MNKGAGGQLGINLDESECRDGKDTASADG